MQIVKITHGSASALCQFGSIYDSSKSFNSQPAGGAHVEHM